MNCEEEIIYRDKILSRASKGEKITPEDRLWLVTHRSINRILGYPYLNTDIISFEPNVNYLIRVEIKKLSPSFSIVPVITVPGGKGKINLGDMTLIDYNGKIVTKKDVKVLALVSNQKYLEHKVLYKSSLGLLGISYQCDYFDEKQHIMIRGNSSTGIPNLAMISEIISDNKILYRCKSPNDNSFESLIFSVEWNEFIKRI